MVLLLEAAGFDFRRASSILLRSKTVRIKPTERRNDPMKPIETPSGTQYALINAPDHECLSGNLASIRSNRYTTAEAWSPIMATIRKVVRPKGSSALAKRQA